MKIPICHKLKDLINEQKKSNSSFLRIQKIFFFKIHQVSETTVCYICQKGKKSNANGINLKRTENARKVLH